MPQENSCGIDVCMETRLENHPHCPHGPTLLFQRYQKSGDGETTIQKYYACSACRDRKDCNFFQRVDEKVSEAKRNSREEINRQHQPPYSHSEYYKRFEEAKRAPPSGRIFCQTCHLLLLTSEKSDHKKHDVLTSVSDDQLRRPSCLLKPLDNKKTNAQYLFSDETVGFMLETFERLGFTHVLCVGSPRIFEAVVSLQQGAGGKMKTLLLDLDHRYQQFFSPAHVCRYNMFNHYFFDGKESQDTYRAFLKAEKLVVVTDPPFGGLVEILALTIKKITEDWQLKGERNSKSLPVLWFFPYFMEKKILEVMPSFTMLDYKVDYSNHAVFQGGPKGRKQGSPVRIFTNITPENIVLPENNYRFCVLCRRYVSLENQHCDKCQGCTSKDGRPYVHCDKCGKCVKSSRSHCDTCNQCELPDHTCGRVVQGCHICGELDHKRRECPNKDRKRKAVAHQGGGKQKKRKRENHKTFFHHRRKKGKKS